MGDVARIVLYIHLRYNLGLNLVGNLNMFLKRHEQDPVNDFERSRNGKIEGIQQYRNPFIDYPDFVGYMWGTSAKESIFMDTLFEVSILLNEHYYYNERKEQFIA